MKRGTGWRIFGLGLILLIGGGIINLGINNEVWVTRYAIESKKIGAELDGYKILQMTDIHSIRSQKQREKIVEKVKKEKPNIILITGDLVDSDYYSENNGWYLDGKIDVVEEETLRFMGELRALAEVYYVYGNHEMVLLDDPLNNRFKVTLEEMGVEVLNNRVVKIFKEDEIINLVGVQDPITLYKDEKYADIEGNNRKRVQTILDDLMIYGKEVSADNFTILLSHRPEYFDLYLDYEIDLAMTGHTHGGVVRLPFVGGLYAHPQGWFPKYSAGIYESGNFKMILSRGIGYSKVPVRIFNPPEIVVVTLKEG